MHGLVAYDCILVISTVPQVHRYVHWFVSYCTVPSKHASS